jgi:hypothetical protein
MKLNISELAKMKQKLIAQAKSEKEEAKSNPVENQTKEQQEPSALEQLFDMYIQTRDAERGKRG